MTRQVAIAQLRHLYSLMVNGHVVDTNEAARGLLGPALESLEHDNLRESVKVFMDLLRGTMAGSTPKAEAVRKALNE